MLCGGCSGGCVRANLLWPPLPHQKSDAIPGPRRWSQADLPLMLGLDHAEADAAIQSCCKWTNRGSWREACRGSCWGREWDHTRGVLCILPHACALHSCKRRHSLRSFRHSHETNPVICNASPALASSVVFDPFVTPIARCPLQIAKARQLNALYWYPLYILVCSAPAY